MQRTFPAFIFLVMILWGCRTVHPAPPPAAYSMAQPQIPVSSLVVPVHLTRDALEGLLQQTLKDLDAQKFQGESGGVQWTATLSGKVDLELSGQQILSGIPLQVEVSKDFGLGKVTATGELKVRLRTLYNIRPDWTVQTFTTLEDHRWTRKPVARVGGLAFPISGLADLIIRSTRQQITGSLDEEIQKALDLRLLLTPLWTALKRPRLLSESMQIWFRFEPQEAGLEAFREENGIMTSAVHVRGLARVKAGSEPELLRPDAQPVYALLEDIPDSLRLMIHTELPYEEAERMAEDRIIGQTFTSGRRSVTVEGVELYGQGDYLIASVRLAGSYKGQVHLRGTPVFNATENRIDLEGFDFDVDTRNVLHRSAAWLFKGNIRSALENQLRFPLEANLHDVRDEINGQLNRFEGGPWIRLHTPGLHLTMDRIGLTPTGMTLDFLLSGLVEVRLAVMD